jgi:hypothetical protein
LDVAFSSSASWNITHQPVDAFIVAHESDSLYHRLFSHPLMVEALVREFVPEALANELDFSNMQRVNPKFHFRWREDREPWQPRV